MSFCGTLCGNLGFCDVLSSKEGHEDRENLVSAYIERSIQGGLHSCCWTGR